MKRTTLLVICLAYFAVLDVCKTFIFGIDMAEPSTLLLMSFVGAWVCEGDINKK